MDFIVLYPLFLFIYKYMYLFLDILLLSNKHVPLHSAGDMILK